MCIRGVDAVDERVQIVCNLFSRLNDDAAKRDDPVDLLFELEACFLIDWLETDLPTLFNGRALSVDGAVADCWGRLIAAAPRPLPAIDACWPPRHWSMTWC